MAGASRAGKRAQATLQNSSSANEVSDWLRGYVTSAQFEQLSLCECTAARLLGCKDPNDVAALLSCTGKTACKLFVELKSEQATKRSRHGPYLVALSPRHVQYARGC